MKPAVRERLHAQVVAAVAGGLTRLDAYQQVAGENGVRPGTVAAAYYRVERERAEGVDTPAVPEGSLL